MYFKAVAISRYIVICHIYCIRDVLTGNYYRTLISFWHKNGIYQEWYDPATHQILSIPKEAIRLHYNDIDKEKPL